MFTTSQISIIAIFIALISALISIFAIYFPWKNKHDSEIFREAIAALERAYRTFNDSGTINNHPIADRLNWLTTARHIEAYKFLHSKLKTDLYKELCCQNEEYWRHQFYLLILKNRINEVSYFESGQIEPRSAIVIYNFAVWPNDKQDSVDVLNMETLFNESILKGNIGLSMYLSKFPEYGGKC